MLAHIDMSRSQVQLLADGQTLHTFDRAGRSWTLYGERLCPAALSLVLDGYPEQLAYEDATLEIYLRD